MKKFWIITLFFTAIMFAVNGPAQAADGGRTKVKGREGLSVFKHPLYGGKKGDQEYLRRYVAKYHLRLGTFGEYGCSGAPIWTRFGKSAIPWKYDKNEKAYFDEDGKPRIRYGCNNDLEIATIEQPKPQVVVETKTVKEYVPYPVVVQQSVCHKPRYETQAVEGLVCEYRPVCIRGHWRNVPTGRKVRGIVGYRRVRVQDDSGYSAGGLYAQSGNGYQGHHNQSYSRYQGGGGMGARGNSTPAPTHGPNPTFEDAFAALSNFQGVGNSGD